MMDGPDREQLELEAAGWEPKERAGQVIWKSPNNGFYYAQGVAVEIIGGGLAPYIPKYLEGLEHHDRAG